MNDESHTNRLIHETSPYLLQHAHNPVDWHPWTNQALTKARAENKPILLSIGYSACHWCHVMAHESFEDADTAALMNRLFVNIKVDREERPDLDRVYQLAHQVLTQRGGGWPLTVFLTPDDLTPFFAGTYFPREPRYGMPGFKDVLTRVAAFYRDHQDDLHKQNAALRDVFKRIEGETAAPAGELNAAPLDAAYRSLSESFDPHFGGFGAAPKFPHPASLEFLLWRAADPKTDAETARHCRHMLDTTLTHMAEGGLYDQLGGGFCRYSVDTEWMIPHFEKMLYDNGPLLALYAQASRFPPLPPGEGGRREATAGEGNFADSLFRRIAKQTAEWGITEMQSPQGGYYCSLDADSEGHEGKYYIWDKEEIRMLLSAEEFAVFAPRYGLDQPSNFEGRWHLHMHNPTKSPSVDSLSLRERVPVGRVRVSENLSVSNPTNPLPHPSPGGRGEIETEALLESARRKLLAARQKRIRPGLDDKVLTSWNGLMIRGMAMAGRLLDEPRFIESALRSVNFIRSQLWKDGRLLASWRDGQAKLPAYLDDYAFLLDSVLELLQARWDSGLFNFARELADTLLANFEDKQSGGFWFTASDQEIPLYRPKTFSDESLPAGNAIAARGLLRLGHLCAEPHYLDAAERTLKAAMPAVNRYPEAHATMLLALQDALELPAMVVLRGKENKLREWQKALDQKYDPRRIMLTIPDDTENLTGLLAQCGSRGDACAYVCRGTQCSLPITEVKALTAI
ncbi:MAG TPA: thioredoxin domain-containing protein [Gammaproteobacteria bacterium]|nr:thioredoxin domain-containing protein [Gammaproteobacteria bacterium]